MAKGYGDELNLLIGLSCIISAGAFRLRGLYEGKATNASPAELIVK